MEQPAQLTMDGYLVEDLGLDFTLPSYPASHRAAHVRKVSSAEIQQFSCFLSPSSPALRGVPVYCALLCYAGRAGDDCEHGEPGQLRGACLPLAPGGGSHASARPARPANRITATGAAAHCAVLSNCM